MKILKSSLWMLVFLMVAGIGSQTFADDYSHTISVYKQSDSVRPFFKDCYGYAVFPLVGKGGIMIGAAFGKGQVYQQGKLSGTVTLTKMSVGFQLGGQSFSEIIFL